MALNKVQKQMIDFLAVQVVSVPSTATSIGNIGDVAVDSAYFYICVNTNTWKRIPVNSW